MLASPTSEPPSFGAWLRAYREQQGIGQTELSKLSGLNLAALYRIEVGQREPALESVERICRALGIRIAIPGYEVLEKI